MAVRGIALLLIVGFFILNYIAPAGRSLTEIRGVDSAVYFAVAHSLLFDRDFDLSNEFQRLPPYPSSWTAPRKETGLPGSPFAIGYSLLALPFLALGSAVDGTVGHACDGYSQYAMVFYSVANVVFVSTGLLILYSFLYRSSSLFSAAHTREVRGWVSALVTAAALTGTSVAYYAFSPMSHASTFLMACVFIRLWWTARTGHGLGCWACLGAAGGLLSICRWQDILFLGGPLLYDLGTLRQWMKTKNGWDWLRSRTAYGFAAGACWIPQLLEWKVIYGKVLTIPQGDGFLQFPPSHLPHVLLSSQHGWFVWTPVVVLGVAGLICGTRFSKANYGPWLVIVALEVTLMGSMPGNWSGRDSFGQRSLTSIWTCPDF